jgi:hypothetical protein
MRRLRSHLSYANVTATIALFVAISGAGAYAAGLAPKSVGAPELRPGAVTANKLRKNAVITPKIKSKAITNPKLAGSSVDGRVLGPGSVTEEKIVTDAITHEKIAPEAITGDQIVESSLTKVPRASFADSATNAESANPLAFADVDENGILNPVLSKGLAPADVSKTATGVYCIAIPGFNPRGAVVTPKTINTDGVIATVTIGGTGTCPAPRVEVQTYNSAGARISARFYAVLYR